MHPVLHEFWARDRNISLHACFNFNNILISKTTQIFIGHTSRTKQHVVHDKPTSLCCVLAWDAREDDDDEAVGAVSASSMPAKRRDAGLLLAPVVLSGLAEVPN